MENMFYISLRSSYNYDEHKLFISLTWSISEFQCHISGCKQLFDTLEGYEHHYNSLHRHVCSSCKRSFPSHRLLDIHILEWHDSLFQVMAERECMVISTPEMSTIIMKHKHYVRMKCKHYICFWRRRFFNTVLLCHVPAQPSSQYWIKAYSIYKHLND